MQKSVKVVRLIRSRNNSSRSLRGPRRCPPVHGERPWPAHRSQHIAGSKRFPDAAARPVSTCFIIPSTLSPTADSSEPGHTWGFSEAISHDPVSV